MLALAAGNALLRHVGRALGLSLTSNALLEGQWMLFSAVFLLGAARALREGAHVRIDLLSSRMGARGRAAVELLGGVACLLPFCAFAVGSTAEAARASLAVWEGSPDPGGLPRWPIKLVVVAGFGLLGLQGISEIIRSARTLFHPGGKPDPS
jgi:TRAP-type mannitol/chloroaromatic compound transport system permease small subunit